MNTYPMLSKFSVQAWDKIAMSFMNCLVYTCINRGVLKV